MKHGIISILALAVLIVLIFAIAACDEQPEGSAAGQTETPFAVTSPSMFTLPPETQYPLTGDFPEFSESDVEAARTVVEDFCKITINSDNEYLILDLTSKLNEKMIKLENVEVTLSDSELSYDPQDPARAEYVLSERGQNQNIGVQNVIVFKVDSLLSYKGTDSDYYEEFPLSFSIPLICGDDSSHWGLDPNSAMGLSSYLLPVE